MAPGVPYHIRVRITTSAEAWEDNHQRTELLTFEERLSNILDECDRATTAGEDLYDDGAIL